MEETLKELEDEKDNPTLKMVKRCPVSFLREVKEDGTEVFIGSLAIHTNVHGELMNPDGVDWENKKKWEEENNKLEAGDPRIIWCFGGKYCVGSPMTSDLYIYMYSVHFQTTLQQVIIARGS